LNFLQDKAGPKKAEKDPNNREKPDRGPVDQKETAKLMTPEFTISEGFDFGACAC
jgi:hypothetical protein